MGTFVGREAIREWLVPVMAPLVGWEYPTKWILVGDDRAVHYWDNIMPTPAGDSGTYLFSGITVRRLRRRRPVVARGGHLQRGRDAEHAQRLAGRRRGVRRGLIGGRAARRREGDRAGRPRAGAVRRHVARRPRCRRRHRRSGRPRATAVGPESAKGNVYGRGRRSLGVDLKSPDGVEVVRRLVEPADVFVEGFRPGVTERLGLGPKDLRGPQPPTGVRAHDGMGAGRPHGAQGRPRPQLRRAGRSAGAHRPQGPTARRRPSTCWATSAVAACCWRWGSARRWSSGPRRVGAR